MKRLLLLRHAKSLRDEAMKDKDRPLNERGRADAPRMASHMHHRGYTPDLVLCSSSRRTRETWELVAPELDGSPTVRFEDNLYLASARTMHHAMSAAGKTNCLLMIGHNPGTEELAKMLARESADRKEQKRLAELEAKYPTCALAVFDFDAQSWRDVSAGQGSLIEFVTPKVLKED